MVRGINAKVTVLITILQSALTYVIRLPDLISFYTNSLMMDRLIELKFNVPLDTKQIILEMLFTANLLTSTEKIKIEVGRKNHNNTINLG